MEAPPAWMVHPLDPRKKIWDNVMLVAILYCVFSAGVELLVDIESNGIWALLELLVDVFYTLDMMVTFRTGLVQTVLVNLEAAEEGSKDTQICWDKGLIARQYYQGWFMPDLLSTIPFDRLTDETNFRSLKAVRALKLARLARLVRVVQLGKFIQQMRSEMLGSKEQQQWEVPLMDMNACDEDEEISSDALL
jgi:hypothetical protein